MYKREREREVNKGLRYGLFLFLALLPVSLLFCRENPRANCVRARGNRAPRPLLLEPFYRSSDTFFVFRRLRRIFNRQVKEISETSRTYFFKNGSLFKFASGEQWMTNDPDLLLFFFCSIEIDFPDLRLKYVTKRVVFLFFFSRKFKQFFNFVGKNEKKKVRQTKKNKKLTSSTSAIGFCLFDQMRVWFEVRIVSKAELFLSLKKKISQLKQHHLRIILFFSKPLYSFS